MRSLRRFTDPLDFLALLDEGLASCCLYTDLANPTSNKIYQAVGYRRVCDAGEYSLAAG